MTITEELRHIALQLIEAADRMDKANAPEELTPLLRRIGSEIPKAIELAREKGNFGSRPILTTASLAGLLAELGNTGRSAKTLQNVYLKKIARMGHPYCVVYKSGRIYWRKLSEITKNEPKRAA